MRGKTRPDELYGSTVRTQRHEIRRDFGTLLIYDLLHDDYRVEAEEIGQGRVDEIQEIPSSVGLFVRAAQVLGGR